MAKKVTITFKNPVNEAYIDHLEVWFKAGVGGTYAQLGADIPFVTGTANYSVEDTSANVIDAAILYYEARAYNDNGGEVELTDYKKVEANITISGATADPVIFTLDTLVQSPTGVYKASANSAYTDNGVSVSGYAGDFDFEIELNNSTYDIDGCMFGVSTASTVGKYNQAPNWEFGAYIQDLALNPRTVINGVAGDPTDNTDITYGAGNKLRLVRVSNNLKLYYNNEERHDFGTIAGTLYLRIAGHVDNYIFNPKVTV